jgi:hypothetical protein
MSSQFWENVLTRFDDATITAADLEAIAYRLVTEQVIYHSDKNGRLAYSLIRLYEREFKQALAPLGVTLEINAQLSYVYAKPLHDKAGTASVAQTLLALVLRAIYDESARQGQFTDDGEVVCDLVELDEKYRLMTGRELPGKGEFSNLMRTMKRWGIARKSEDGPEMDIESGAAYTIVIRPAIAQVLGETALTRLAQWAATESDPGIEGTPSEENIEVTE